MAKSTVHTDNTRVVPSMLFVGFLILWVYFARHDLRPDMTVLDVLLTMRIPLLLVTLVTLLFLCARRKGDKPLTEPDPQGFRGRREFIEALQQYAERQGYHRGWVDQRGKELWPGDERVPRLRER